MLTKRQARRACVLAASIEKFKLIRSEYCGTEGNEDECTKAIQKLQEEFNRLLPAFNLSGEVSVCIEDCNMWLYPKDEKAVI